MDYWGAPTTTEDTGAPPVMIGSRGIGRAVVENALESGYRVAAIDVRAEALDAIRAERASERLLTAAVDTTDAETVDGWLAALVAEHRVPRALGSTHADDGRLSQGGYWTVVPPSTTIVCPVT